MNTERYERLAEAYGADIGRWPQADREAARVFQAREPEAARRILAEAAALDHLLHRWSTPAPGAALRERVLAGAPRPRAARRGFGFWLSGAGLAAAGVAGLIVGIAGSSAAVSDVRADDLLAAAVPDDASTSFTPFTVSNRQLVRRAV